MPGGVQLLESLEAARVAGLQADLLARLRVHAVVQRDFQDLRRIQITRQQVRFLAEGTHLDTAGAAAFAGVLQGLALAHQLLHVSVRIEHGRIAMAQADDLHAGLQELVGGVLRDMDRKARLQLVKFLLDLENHVGEVVHAAVAVLVDTADVDVREVVIGTGLAGGDAHLGRGRLVVELDPQAAQEFLRLLVGEGALLHALLVEGIEVLVDVAGVHGIPSVQLRDRPEMHEPVHLDGLPEVAGGMGRDPVADGGDLLELGLALRVGAFRGHLFRQGGVALGEKDRGVAGNAHGVQLLLLVGGLGVFDVIQGGDVLLDPRLHVQKALPVHPAVHGGVAGGALLHELGKHTGMVRLFPLLGHVAEDALALRLALPVGNHLTLIGVDVLLADVIGLQLAGVQDMEVLHGVAGEFREGRDRLGLGAALTHNELVRADVDGLLRADLIEVFRAEHGNRVLSVVFLVESRLDEGALDS